jgi:sterol desaturase/sphingolipid hydroxylase (fatty acid hydroxylase superfamily)
MASDWESDVARWLADAHPHVTAMTEAAALFLLISAVVNRRNLVAVITKAFPRSIKVNVLTFLFDTLFIIGPVSWMLGKATDFVSSHRWVLFDEARYDALPAWLVAFLVVFVGDFVGYFRHRLEHSRVLWPTHALHHSDDDMTWFTLYRFHPLNRVTTVLIDGVALVALGFPAWAIVLNGVVRHYYGMFVHVNVPWTFGILGRVFVSPAMHRWHHVLEGPGVGTNFATVFSVFDQAFGTFHLPGPCEKSLGVPGVRHDAFVSQMLYPVAALVRRLRR